MKQLIALIFVFILFTGCDEVPKKSSSADTIAQEKTEIAMQEATRQVGMPSIINFQEKKVMKQIYELRDQENLICYAYLFNKMTGEIGQFLGKCIGYGIPYSTQFSNPEKFGTVDGGEYGALNPYVMPQPEPNGLFMPEGLSATWLLLIDPISGEPRPVYVEPEIIVSPFKLH